MESESIVNCALDLPTKSKFYMRVIIMDDDTTTPAHLAEDKGENQKGTYQKTLLVSKFRLIQATTAALDATVYITWRGKGKNSQI